MLKIDSLLMVRHQKKIIVNAEGFVRDRDMTSYVKLCLPPNIIARYYNNSNIDVSCKGFPGGGEIQCALDAAGSYALFLTATLRHV